MIAVLMMMGLLAQTPYVRAGGAEPYAPPPVRPFEPGESFGQEAATQAGPAPVRVQPLTQPETLDRFGNGYSPGPQPVDSAYQQAVAAAEARADAMAGPLDGGWLVMEGARARGRLVLSDPGGDRPVEGAFSATEGTGRAVAVTGRRDGDHAELSVGGRPVRLDRAGDGWRGVWSGAPVILQRGF
ncbi:MAG TPA: hypothetical protein PLQ03_03285 [Brevundimonas sp.]|uniref:hypothetical protein n=1 Tax=Brevundimonas sp. TaxID=1871086 RepID=UPI002617EB8C|nr:hypothetical protein [Brevundimonas sp.]HRO32413.1 hypothetical protein [Brevundimonas sp.]